MKTNKNIVGKIVRLLNDCLKNWFFDRLKKELDFSQFTFRLSDLFHFIESTICTG